MAINFEKFTVDAIRIIDELRSTNADPKNVDSNSAEPVESRINTLYRAIGLPAFVTKEDIKKEDPKKLNNGNLHETDPEDPEVNDLLEDAQAREASSSEELSEEEQLAFLDDMNESIISSLKKFEDGGRKKGGLFPMVVNGNVRITPHGRRVDGAFFQKQKRHNGITYRRPLIELIVLLRLRTKGFADATDDQKLQDSFPELRDAGFFTGGGKSLLSIQVLRSLLEVITNPEGVVKFIYSTVKSLGRIRSQVRDTFKDSKEATVAEEQPRVGESDGKGKLEQQKAEKEILKSEGEAMITLLEYDDTLDVTLRTTATKNMQNALFAPMILETLLSDTREIDKSIKESEAKKETLDRLHKKLNKNMDLILGTYSGISGIDVLVVITALFSMEEGDLLGLLNKESIERLAKLKKVEASSFEGQRAEVFEAIAALEAKTEEIFKILDEHAEKVKLEEKIRRVE
jgi:hypothetical protein